MAKVKNTFNLSKHEPFTINTPSGSYEIPALETLAYDDWKDVATVSNGKDVLALIRLLRELMKEDTKTLAAITCDEAELIEGGTGLPTVRLLAHELIGVAQKALDALGAEGGGR